MRILLGSHRFHPDVGGIEEVSTILAEEFSRAGHEVKVVTRTRSRDEADAAMFEVIRRPWCGRMIQLLRWCEVYFQNNISLQSAWALFLCPRPWVIAHHTWITRVHGEIGWRDLLKRVCLRPAENISVSAAVAAHLPVASTVIGNPYRDGVFRTDPRVLRDRELIFVGRLVSDKGVDLLIDALVLLQQDGVTPRLTIVGAGPEDQRLRERCESAGLSLRVTFAGVRRDAELVQLLNQHQILVIPSRWKEPFGIVALEAISCGCVVVGANSGGLPDAIGPAGILYERGSISALVDALRSVLGPGANLDRFRQHAKGHLASHAAGSVAARYLEVLERVAGR